MAVRRWRKLAMLHKLETTYMEDAAPGDESALVATNISFTPIEAEEVSRDLFMPYLGNHGVVLAAEYGKIEFDIEVAGSGSAGVAPKYGSLLRVTGMAEDTVGGEVVYSIIEDDVPSGTLYFNSDGVQHAFIGAQANVQVTFTPKQIPKFRFTLQGMLGDIEDMAMPAFGIEGWTTPVVVSKANTVMSLHAAGSVAESVTINLGNTLTPRFLIGDERMLISDRKPTGTVVVEGRTLAEVNWFAKARSRDRGLLSLTHGKTAGNIVEISAPAVEIGKPSQGETDGIVNYSLPIALCPVTGLDELRIAIR